MLYLVTSQDVYKRQVLGGPCILERQRAAAASDTGSGVDPVGA